MDAVPQSSNHLLASLPPADFELFRPHLETIELVQESVLVAAGDRLTQVFFPHSGVISLVVSLAAGETIEVAMIGRDSIFGVYAALGDAIALSSAVVLMPGVASTLDLDRLHAAAEQSASFRSLLIRHGLAVHAQVQQTAGCNAAHTVESRLARCLAQTSDLSGHSRLDLTQESLAQMIGARRNSVSLVASMLQQSNFIHYSRGHIEITNMDGLSKTACECYATVKSHYERLLRPRISA